MNEKKYKLKTNIKWININLRNFKFNLTFYVYFIEIKLKN